MIVAILFTFPTQDQIVSLKTKLSKAEHLHQMVEALKKDNKDKESEFKAKEKQ
jgi:cell shape-determining protein MreC